MLGGQGVANPSELFRPFVVVLHHRARAWATSLVLPVLIFPGAMVSIPKPSKRRVTTVALIEVTVLVLVWHLPWEQPRGAAT